MNQTSKYKFTIIVPFYNEEENASRLEATLSSYIEKEAVMPTCVLFVNDGSKDNGGGLIKEACARHEGFFYIGFEKNCGLSAAIKAGIDWCQSEYVGYIDADLQTNPEDFNLLLPHLNEFQLVTGIRAGRKDSFVKKASSKIANSYRRMMTHDNAIDTGCPLKVMQTLYAKKIPFFTGMHRFIPALILMAGGQFEQLPVRHYPRTAGKAKYNLLNRLWGPFIDCFAYRWMKKRFIDYQVGDTNIEK